MNRTLPSPEPVVGPRGVMKGEPLVAVQLQLALAPIVTVNSVPAAATNPVGPSLTVNEQFEDVVEGDVGGLFSQATRPMARPEARQKMRRRITGRRL